MFGLSIYIYLFDLFFGSKFMYLSTLHSKFLPRWLIGITDLMCPNPISFKSLPPSHSPYPSLPHPVVN